MFRRKLRTRVPPSGRCSRTRRSHSSFVQCVWREADVETTDLETVMRMAHFVGRNDHASVRVEGERRCPMSVSFPIKIMFVAMLFSPFSALAQSGGGGGGGGSAGGSAGGASAGGAASGPSAGTGSAAGSPNAGSAGAGTAAINGVPSGPANAGGLNNSGNDPSGAGNSAKAPTAPGTNTLGTANSSGSTGGTTGSSTIGMANNRAAGVGTGGRIDGTVTPGPSMPGDAEIRAEDPKVDAKIKSICKGC